jgi:hypothetical protein
MENAGIGWTAAIIIGGLADWLAELFMKSNMGVFSTNIMLGIVGAIVANFHPFVFRRRCGRLDRISRRRLRWSLHLRLQRSMT